MEKGTVLTLMCILMLLMLNFHSSQGGVEKEELQLLLSFKASIHVDPLHFLSNWVSTTTAPTLNICNWHGITCNNNNNSNNSHITAVSLSGKNISGEISSSIFHLPYITNLDLSNNQLVGELILSNNHHSFSSSLRYLNLSNNNLTGPLPITLFSTSFFNLQTLDLSNNMFSGKIPNQIGILSGLKYLDLGGNVLVGNIPSSITNITSLQYLTLSSNQLVGEIPEDIILMKNLKWIYLGYNNLSGEIPKNIGELSSSLNHLDLVYNNLTGTIPESIGNLTSLRYLFLYQNKLTGPIPESVFELKNLISLDLSDNYLSGEISNRVVQLQKLEILHLFSNRLSGKIPKSLASLGNLQILQLWSNRLTGEIPKELGKNSNLTVLDLSSNNLTGNIPNSLCGNNNNNLHKLILFSNNFEGEIPDGISSCTSLQRVRLQNNKLSGKLPFQITKLPQVYLFDISFNNFSGRIDDRKWNMPALQMLSLANNNFEGELPNSLFGSEKLEELDLSENQFSGYIPNYGFRNITELVELKLSNNRLIGNIPEQLCECERLVVLDLSKNKLSGQIPVKLADMPVLGLLDLSENELSGEIPRKLGRVESLVEVNISYNHFRGSLPSTGVFLAVNASSVAGNNLCDDGGESGLPACKSNGNNNIPTRRLLLCFVIIVIGVIAFAMAAILVRRSRKKNLDQIKRVEDEDGTWWEVQFFDSKAAKVMSIQDVLSSVKEGKVISRERNCVCYEGKCMGNDDMQMQFVVKEICDCDSNSLPWDDDDDDDIVVRFGKLRHPNIVKLIGSCRSGKRGYLVYEQQEGNSNLGEILHKLNWQRRWKVAVGIAKALKYLHSSECLVVGEVSPEIVLVDGKGVPRLKLNPPGIGGGGGGLPCFDLKGFVSSPYVAPEAIMRRESVTDKSEIYGYGIVLIELLTGRSWVDTEAGGKKNNNDIVEWARYCYSDCHVDTWIDPVMKGRDESTYHNEIVQTMNLALQCTATDPTVRPCARDVLTALQTLNHNKTSTFC